MCANESQDILRGAEAVKPTDPEIEQSYYLKLLVIRTCAARVEVLFLVYVLITMKLWLNSDSPGVL